MRRRRRVRLSPGHRWWQGLALSAPYCCWWHWQACWWMGHGGKVCRVSEQRWLPRVRWRIRVRPERGVLRRPSLPHLLMYWLVVALRMLPWPPTLPGGPYQCRAQHVPDVTLSDASASGRSRGFRVLSEVPSNQAIMQAGIRKCISLTCVSCAPNMLFASLFTLRTSDCAVALAGLGRRDAAADG